MTNEIKEEIIIILNDTRNKYIRIKNIYNKNNMDTIYIERLIDMIDQEIKELIERK